MHRHDDRSPVPPGPFNGSANLSAHSSCGIFNTSQYVPQYNNWDQLRRRRGIRGDKGETVWYKTSGRYLVCTPSDSIPASIDDLYIHRDEGSGHSQIWVFDVSGSWITVRPGDRQPSNPRRRLHIQESGDPSWVTNETWNVYKSKFRNLSHGGSLVGTLVRPFNLFIIAGSLAEPLFVATCPVTV